MTQFSFSTLKTSLLRAHHSVESLSIQEILKNPNHNILSNVSKKHGQFQNFLEEERRKEIGKKSRNSKKHAH